MKRANKRQCYKKGCKNVGYPNSYLQNKSIFACHHHITTKKIFGSNWSWDEVEGEVIDAIDKRDRKQIRSLMKELENLPTDQVKDDIFLDEQHGHLKRYLRNTKVKK